MKKTIIVSAILIFAQIFAFAQEAEQKGGAGAGTFGIGINAGAILNNSFNTDKSLIGNDNSIYLRYFISSQGAIRLQLGANLSQTLDTRVVRDDAAYLENPLSNKQLEDRRTTDNTMFIVRAGYQHYLYNSGRVRAYAGADLGVEFGKQASTMEYGNTMTATNNNPSSSNFIWYNGGRVIESVEPTRTFFSGAAFGGAEYALLPNLHLGIEVGLRYNHQLSSQQYITYETVIGGEVVEMDEVRAPADRDSYLPTYTKFSLFIDL